MCLKAKNCIVPDNANLTVAGQVVKHGENIRMKCSEGHYLLYGEKMSTCLDGKFHPPIHEVMCYGTASTVLFRVRL